MYKTSAEIDGAILKVSGMAAMRQVWDLFIASVGTRWWLIASLFVSVLLISLTKTSTGDLLGGYTDHLHHARATWTFLNLGFEVYSRPFGETGLEVPYPQPGLFWAQFPVAYPPGMFVVFLPVALLGRYVPLSQEAFGKLAIIYLVVITHAALWVVDSLLRRPGKAYGFLPVLMLWLYSLRVALMGFYDGAWLLAGAVATTHLARGRNAHALIWFTVAGLTSYRAAALVPLATLALWQYSTDGSGWRKKLPILATAVVGCSVVLVTFWALNHYSPHSAELRAGADSPLLRFSARTYAVVAIGWVATIALSIAASGLTAVTAAVSTLLSVLHGGHWWHGFVCTPVLLSLGVVPTKMARGVPIALLFVALMWQFAFDYQPFRFLDELLLFVQRDGAIDR
jgi:hypothetical protein